MQVHKSWDYLPCDTQIYGSNVENVIVTHV